MHKDLCNKLENMKTNIDTFYHGDVMKMLDEIPENCGFISFPPFFKGGYEKMWKEIENFFEYTEPEYEMYFTEDDVKAGDPVVNGNGAKLTVTDETVDMAWVEAYGKGNIAEVTKVEESEEKENDKM